jgi:hypothetical protein
MNSEAESPVGRTLRETRLRAGIPVTVLADTLGIPCQRLRRLEIGTRADPELERRAAPPPCSPNSRHPTPLDSTRSIYHAGLHS